MTGCRRIATLLLALVAALPLRAQVDTVSHRPFFSWRDAAIVEGFAIMAVAVAPLDRRWAERLQDTTVQENRNMRDVATFVRTVADPGSFIIGIGLYTAGRLTKNKKAADLGLHGTEALLVGAQLGNLLKGVVGRARPYVNVDDLHNYSWGR